MTIMQNKACLDKVSLIRFCIAREFHFDKSFNLWVKWAEWRIDYQPQNIKRREIKNSTLNKCFYLSHLNKLGNPWIVIKPGATEENYELSLMWKLASYLMEKAWKIADRNGTTQIWVLFDRTGMTQATERRWLHLYKGLSSIIQDYYPERLYKAYILHMNWFARAIFALWKPFIAKKTRSKLVILRDEEHLLEFFEEENLPISLNQL